MVASIGSSLAILSGSDFDSDSITLKDGLNEAGSLTFVEAQSDNDGLSGLGDWESAAGQPE